MIIDDLSYYGASYLNYGWSMKDHGGYGFTAAPISFDFRYFNLRHSPIQVDMRNFTFDFIGEKARNDFEPVLKMQLPLIKDWSYDFDYQLKLLLLPLGGHMKITLS